ncbi:MAG: hypothetical protein KDM63_03705 [Verrucomicrobiae bacterium]|nr:hypothetical protein [Verrucomicrobiae bacterium]
MNEPKLPHSPLPSHQIPSLKKPDRRPRVFHNAYPCIDKDKQGELAKNRDAAAFAEILGALNDHGCQHGSMLFNYALTDGSEPIQDDHHQIRRGDVIVTVTRPPLHDLTFCTKKYVPRSGTELERLIFEAVNRWLAICSRSQLRLSDPVVKAWEARVRRELGQFMGETPADFLVSQNLDARLREWRSLNPAARSHRLDHNRDYRSLGCFLHLPAFEGLDCRLIVSFGMGSRENLIWNHIVRTRFDHWFDAPVFALAEMDLNDIPDTPQTLFFSEDVPVRVLLELTADDPLFGQELADEIAA